MTMRLSVISVWMLLIVLLSLSKTSHAGAYIFASEANGIESITHPPNYSGSGGTVTVRVCIDPTSPNASAMEYSVQNNVDVYNALNHTHGNLLSGSSNNVPPSVFDFESVSLHEIGHCLGMAHVNMASESGVTGVDRNYTKTTIEDVGDYNLDPGADGVRGSSDDIRGDDVNLHWFRKSNNDPFTIDTVVDSTTYSRELSDLPSGHSFAANADRAVSTLLGYPLTESVMQQGTHHDEAQRTLSHDDVATLRYAMSGVDERQTGGQNSRDNYTINLEYGGISTSGCDINMKFATGVGLARCLVGGTRTVWNNTRHYTITSATIEIGQEYNWFFNAPNSAPEMDTIGDLVVLDGDSLIVNISASDDDGDELSYTDSDMPSFANLVDNSDGTATLTISPDQGGSSSHTVSVTVSDDGEPVESDSETFDIIVTLDSDDDGLTDYHEINVYGTSPVLADSDGDFIDDGDEVMNGSDPNDDTSWPNFADGDIAPLGVPDGNVNAADYLLMQRIVLGELLPTSLELSHGDIYPDGAPDGVIDVSDLILMKQLVQ